MDNTITEELTQLKASGWMIYRDTNWNKGVWYLSNPPKTGACYVFDKDNSDEVAITISIHLDDGLYKVYCSAEHRCSGPVENFKDAFANEYNALQKAIEVCRFWDDADSSEKQQGT